MKVVSIRSRMLFGEFYPRAEGKVPEGAKFVVGAGLTVCGPVLLFCYVVGQLLPFYLMMCNMVLGILWGISMFEQPQDAAASCVPMSTTPEAPSNSHTRPVREVA